MALKLNKKIGQCGSTAPLIIPVSYSPFDIISSSSLLFYSQYTCNMLYIRELCYKVVILSVQLVPNSVVAKAKMRMKMRAITLCYWYHHYHHSVTKTWCLNRHNKNGHDIFIHVYSHTALASVASVGIMNICPSAYFGKFQICDRDVAVDFSFFVLRQLYDFISSTKHYEDSIVIDLFVSIFIFFYL